MKGGILLLYVVGHGILQRVDQGFLALGAELVIPQAADLFRNIFLTAHETYEHVFVRKFFCTCPGYKSFEHIVVLYGRVTSDGFESTMVVRKDQSVGRDDNT